MNQEIIQLGMALAELTSKNTVSYIKSKMEIAKQKNDLEEQSLAYTEIINNLLEDKESLITISLEYKYELERVIISDEDIEHLHNTLNSILKILTEMTPINEEGKKALEAVIKLLNKDTLKTMQLLGFNYKEAIGLPLTEVSADFIKKKLSVSKKTKR